jgi:hypothetical protein
MCYDRFEMLKEHCLAAATNKIVLHRLNDMPFSNRCSKPAVYLACLFPRFLDTKMCQSLFVAVDETEYHFSKASVAITKWIGLRWRVTSSPVLIARATTRILPISLRSLATVTRDIILDSSLASSCISIVVR